MSDKENGSDNELRVPTISGDTSSPINFTHTKLNTGHPLSVSPEDGLDYLAYLEKHTVINTIESDPTISGPGQS